MVHLSITTMTYLIFEAKTIPEYTHSFSEFATATMNTFDIFVVILNTASIYQVIENVEKAIEQRNEQAAYIKLNEKIERFSKWFYLIYVQCNVIVVAVPNLLKTIFFYFTTDLKSDAYQLPFRTW